jgi:hypothetical protein
MITRCPGRALALTAWLLAAVATTADAQTPGGPPATLPPAVAPPPTPWSATDAHAAPAAPGAPADLAEHPAHSEHLDVEHEADAEHEGDAGFFFHTEYLLLQPRRSAADFAILAADPGRPIGSVESLYWNSDSGFRLGGGYRLGDGWEFSALYTYFHSTNHRDLAAPAGGAIFSTLTSPGDTFSPLGFSTAAGDTNFNLNVVDVTIGHTFHAGHGLEYTLSAGGRYARIDQNLSALYDNNDFVSSPLRFEGGGLTARGEARWNFWRGLGAYASVTGSLLSGDIRASVFEGTADGTVYVNAVDHFRVVIPVAEMGLGLSWKSESFQARIGYEIANWFGLINSPDFVSDTANKYSPRTGDLSLDGLSVMFEFDF